MNTFSEIFREREKEKNRHLYRVTLYSYSAEKKIAVIRITRELVPDRGLRQTKDMVEAVPVTFPFKMSHSNAVLAVKQLKEIGAVAEVVPVVLPEKD